ncbi:AraC family transcriptional regulator of adaptative response/methylated-DNA-[protein]-cysteine methyltransferase [Povalibacter uvarum]|uniref:AraC family transcriptional regulator of adaptative response/methylated-DNA-[protein]-cysteine methyltransferase n=2 Tax=Povalibacter uvarum TaxID=732238 RepID=A0A841HQG3_9GAMM|nr:bifunctional DNA-binding transcriptional regulator/O6-methylguanine-DNA methyltransferase Ada [Povalibacter uvarum]MBB6094282.1 AraC family transcriptional regulator of adaptative response/methylated-DNA-[protein]-cysteine methyltransferase [Povalibacter uvarum]
MMQLVSRTEPGLMKATAPTPPVFHSDEARWDAVVRRDRAADGQFYYSVRTTGVYCRPSCASRRARRENVAFHTTQAAAEKAGFRPCRRCKPEQPSLDEQYAARIAKACRLIETSESAPSLATLAKAAGLSAYHFHRVFKAVTGVTPKAYASAHRTERTQTGLARRGSVTDAIYEAGFNSNAPFYSKADALLGMKPGEFRAGGKNAVIRFAVAQCSLGALLVAATDKGVCSILLGDDPEALVRDLQDRFERAQLIGGDAQFEQMVAKVVGFVEAPSIGLDLPLDIRGTAFQQRVWQALRKIPAGSTVSYADMAKRIGAPKAVRAVAQACAANAIAIAIPCHRVVRTDGNLSGYRWGIERKRTLLEREKAA